MELGERIKQARLAAGLSQRQLCGGVITRNMLSLIESGKARPSMDTLTYFARTLGKSVSYFLDEQGEASPNQYCLEQAEKAWQKNAFADALAALEPYQGPDPSLDGAKRRLECLICTALAQQVLAQGQRAYCVQLLDRADQVGGVDRQRVLLRYAARPEKARELAKALPSITQELLLLADGALAEGEPERAIRLLDAAQEQDDRWMLLRGKAWMQLGQCDRAVECLTKACSQFPRVCLPLLERCYKELGDYKRAYECACKQRELNFTL